MREPQVTTADLDIDRRAERVQRHRGALGMPARTAGAPRALPGELALARRLPHRDIERVVLTRIVRPVPVLRRQPERRRLISDSPARDVPAAEEHSAVALVRGSLGQQPGGQRDHLPDIRVRPRLRRRTAHPECGHVPVEIELLDRREFVVMRPRLACGRQQHVIDICHVARHEHLGSARVQHPAQRVGPYEGRSVPQVGDVVGCDTARVHPRTAGQRKQDPAQPDHRIQAAYPRLTRRQPDHRQPSRS